jgi:hypothetical protein
MGQLRDGDDERWYKEDGTYTPTDAMIASLAIKEGW